MFSKYFKLAVLPVLAIAWIGCDNTLSQDNQGSNEFFPMGENEIGDITNLPMFIPGDCDIMGKCDLPETGCEERIFENYISIDNGCTPSLSGDPNEGTCSATSFLETRVIKNICADSSKTTLDSINFKTQEHFVNGIMQNPEQDCEVEQDNMELSYSCANGIMHITGAEYKKMLEAFNFKQEIK